MPTISDNYHDNLIETIKDLANNSRWFASSINLGGVPGSGGGSGGPPGGFYGQLIQAQVAYDTTEAAVAGGPVASGWSLVDNLNHIRYLLNTKNPSLIVQDESVQVASGITVLNFLGAGITAALVGNAINITVTATGGGSGDSGITVIWEDVTSQVPAAGDNYAISQQAISGSIKVFLNGLLQKPTNITQTTTTFHTIFSPITGDELVATYLASGVQLPSGITVYDDGVFVASGVFKLNFINALVTYAGGIASVSGIGGGGTPDTKKSLVTITDTTEGYLQDKIRPGSNVIITLISGGANEFLQVASTASGGGAGTSKVKVSSNDTTENYLENKVSAGENITVTTLNDGANEVLKISVSAISGTLAGARVYSSSGIQIPNSTDYVIGFDTERWDTNNFWSSVSPGVLTVRASGYYSVAAAIKFASSSTGNRGLKVRKNSSCISAQFITNTTTNSCYISTATNSYFDVGDTITVSVYQSSGGNLELLREDGTSPELVIQKFDAGISPNFSVAASGVSIASGVTGLNFTGGLCASAVGNTITVTSANPPAVGIGCRVYSSSGISLPTGVGGGMPIRLDSERWDTDDMHSLDTNLCNKLTCNASGVYLITVGVELTANGTGVRAILTYLNGSTMIDRQQTNGNASITADLSTSTIYKLNKGDYIDVRIYQNSGTTLTINAIPNQSPEVSIQKIG